MVLAAARPCPLRLHVTVDVGHEPDSTSARIRHTSERDNAQGLLPDRRQVHEEFGLCAVSATLVSIFPPSVTLPLVQLELARCRPHRFSNVGALEYEDDGIGSDIALMDHPDHEVQQSSHVVGRESRSPFDDSFAEFAGVPFSK